MDDLLLYYNDWRAVTFIVTSAISMIVVIFLIDLNDTGRQYRYAFLLLAMFYNMGIQFIIGIVAVKHLISP